MNYQDLKSHNIFRISLAFNLVALFCLSFFLLFSSPANSQTLPDCNDPSVKNVDPGISCLFYGLSLCQAIPHKSGVPASSILSGATEDHRFNCADLSDLPLCNQIDSSSPVPIRECVKECSDPSFNNSDNSLTRGTDYAVHNRDCVRFCDSVENGITANNGINCVARSCHQLPASTDPDGVNCSLLACNKLTPDELNESIFNDDSKKYCEGDNLKCQEFTQTQLPYVKLRIQNPTCTIHDCRATSSSCSNYATDDIATILNKGSAYVNQYQTYVNAGLDINATTLCNPVPCEPIIQRQYRCLPLAEANPTTPNSNCDDQTSSSCSSAGYCTKEIDCNLAINSTETECVSSPGSTYNGNADPVKSWFYRPRPMAKATHPDGSIRNMDNSMCYTRDNMKNHGWGEDVTLLGYFHDYAGDDTRSPGTCNCARSGSRGYGYIYLAGVDGLLYNMPSDYAGYVRGYIDSTYTDDDGLHKITMCLRYNNAMIPQKTGGARECGITIGFDECFGQVCGYDECQDLYISDSNPKACAMENDPSGACQFEVDTYVRARAVKYGNYICGFIDMQGTLAYEDQYFDGSEKLSSGECISGTVNDLTGECDGSKNTNEDEGLATIWRTVGQIPYIKNNRTSGPRGYLDLEGRLFEEQECAKVPYRVPPPNMYNLGNMTNSAKLFSLPLFILNSRIRKGDSISYGTTSDPLGHTDFHFPEIEVKFGNTNQLLSLGINYDGYEETTTDPTASASITAGVSGFNEIAEVFVRKESFNELPYLCLYRKVQNEYGVYLSPVQISCVRRNLPEINSNDLSNILRNPNNNYLNKLIIAQHSSSSHFDPKISLRYLSSTSLSDDTCNSATASCTDEVILGNADVQIDECSDESEKYKICARREECTKLNIECMQNEIDLNNARNAGERLDSYLTKRRICTDDLLELCNAKKGITSDDTALNSFDFNFNDPVPNNSKLYGWFNEICISSGFESKLYNTISHIVPDGQKGKCIIDINSPYLTDGDNSTNCDAGGKAPNCLCTRFTTPEAGQEVRQVTAREAGLCVDIAIPQTCPAIDYTPNLDSPDNHVNSSLGQNSYGSTSSQINNVVHISHQNRTNANEKGHAEFAKSIIGMTDVNGDCNGFWKNDGSAAGVTITPKLNCINNNGNALWENNTRNACVRYQCPQIGSSGIDINGSYQGGYAIGETGENKGLSHGFAFWPSYEKTNDFLETANANSCITGFKANGSTTLTASGSVNGQNAILASLQGLITGYNGGTLPDRQCNQIGQYLPVNNNICQRITCPAINPPTPSGPLDTNAWSLWQNSGGATYSSVNASRSDLRIQSESISSGTCNESIGFFTNPGGSDPTRACDHLGNWLPVENPCATTCDAITSDVDASNFNNGFAKWNTANIQNINNNRIIGEFTSCASGYVTNPYPPSRDIDGNALEASIANDLTRPAENPKRICVIADSGQGYLTSVWGAAVNGCINSCPGEAIDNRIGVGVTTHNLSSGTVTLNWPSTALGDDAYLSNFNDNIDAGSFANGRTNGTYLVKRHCNSNGEWSAPEPMCAVNGGQIDHATYDLGSVTGYEDSIAAGSNSSINGSCVTNYWKSNFDNNAAPKRACLFENGNNFIDKVYLGLIDGTQGCEERRCEARNQTKTSRSKLPAVAFNDVRTRVGGQVVGSCLNNETNNSGAMTYADLENGAASPKVTCQTGGVWSDANGAGVNGDDNCKIGCSFPLKREYMAHGTCRSAYEMHGHTLKHGEKVIVSFNIECDSWTTSKTYVHYCNNGQAIIDSGLSSARWGHNIYHQYDPITRILSDMKGIAGANSSPYYVTGQSYIDKEGNPQNLVIYSIRRRESNGDWVNNWLGW